MKKSFAFLRSQVRDIQAATRAGTTSFKELAAMHESDIYTANYMDLQYIYCDTMAIVNGKTVITEQNLQYFPAKFRYYIVKYQ